jgi:Gluconate 2-dehydrogenase subunit 3
MRLIDKTPKVDRRAFLRASGATAAAAVAMPSTVITGKAFAADPVALKPDTFATLVKMARDLYPHDKQPDAIYAAVIEGHDKAAKDDPAKLKMLEEGAELLDAYSERMGNGKYLASQKEEDRVAVLKIIETDAAPAFFQAIRGSLVTGLYNNQAIWKQFGYEGESAGFGGYIERGFNDIDWLKA